MKNAELIKLLVEAHSNELALINTLQEHVSIAKRGSSYRTLLESHLRETQEHARLLQKRLQALGYTRSLPAAGYELIQNVAKQGLVLLKGPMDALRGGRDVEEKMVRNAMDEVMTEGLEIGAYDVIESTARTFGDHATAELAATIRLDEERMFEALRKEIPDLAERFARAHAPEAITNREPWEGYDEMTVEEIKTELADAGEGLRAAVRRYERANKNRTTVIQITETERVGI